MIQPIEMQMILPHSDTVGTTQQHEHQKVVNDNFFAADEVAKEVKHNSETVIQKDANEFAEYHYDAKEEGRGTYQNPHKQKRKPKMPGEEQAAKLHETKSASENREPRVNIQI